LDVSGQLIAAQYCKLTGCVKIALNETSAALAPEETFTVFHDGRAPRRSSHPAESVPFRLGLCPRQIAPVARIASTGLY
jgi:hypothetical protein